MYGAVSIPFFETAPGLFSAYQRSRPIRQRLGSGKPDQGEGMSESNLEDRAAIHDLFTRYCCALDNGEIEAVVDCFTVDAILKSPVIDIRGRDEIRAFAGRFAAQRAAGTQFRHMVSNIAVTITGNRAAASAYLL